MRTLAICFLSVALLHCATVSDRPASVAAPTVTVDVPGTIFFGAGNTAPVTLEVSITNHATTPLRVRQIEASTPTMTTYRLQNIRQRFDEMIATGETKTLKLFTNAVTSVNSPKEPLSVRTIVTLEANGVPFREITMR